MREEYKTVYVSEDGKYFINKKECTKHEADLEFNFSDIPADLFKPMTDDKWEGVIRHYMRIICQNVYFKKFVLYLTSVLTEHNLKLVQLFMKKNTGDSEAGKHLEIGHRYFLCFTPEYADDSEEHKYDTIGFAVKLDRVKDFYKDLAMDLEDL